MQIRMEKFGRAFSTRPRGSAVARSVVAATSVASDVELDFSEVLAISYSFADQFVGDLAAAHCVGNLAVVGASTEVEAVLGRALGRRGLGPAVLRLPAASTARPL